MIESPKSGDRVFDLLKNEEFVLWVTNPREESNHYWSKWISSNPDRRIDVELARQTILASDKRIKEKIPEEGYDHILERIFTQGQNRPKVPKRSVFWRPISIAACIVFMVISVVYILMNEPFYNADKNLASVTLVEKEVPFGEKLTTQLPDGSIVVLNSGSKISFPDGFAADLREVSLTGEAFFEVKPDPEKPFIVSVNGNKVSVLGTSFDIKSYPDDSLIQVSVATGKVSYTIPTGESLILEPGQGAIHNLSSGVLLKDQVDKLQTFGWKDNIIYFRSVTFEQVVYELEKWYGVDIVSNGNYAHIGNFSGEFRNETLSQVLDGLSFIYKFNFRIDGKTVILEQNENL